ncbi:ribosome-binding factor A [Candidatus Parcubacteria bacterium]|nr:MAG: ribosome-binding factor A [Candidatus Parcubacteria bacterium]
MASKRQIQVAEIIAHLAADYFARESNRESLITVTRADISPDLKNVIIFLSVLPESAEEQVLHFAKRSRTDFRDYVKSKSRLKFLPNFDFEIDYGEKNRQLIDDLTRN